MGSRRRWTTTAALAAATSVLLAGCAGGGLTQGGGDAAEGGSIAEAADLSGASYTVGGKNFDEQLVLCEIAVAALESAGATVTNRCNTGATDVTRNALLAGDIDMYWEYTGTAQVSFFGGEPIQDSQQQYDTVAETDLTQNQIHWLTPTLFNNTYAMAMLEAQAAELNISTLSDMAAYYNGGGTGPTCVEAEYLNRDDGLPGMLQTYGFQLPAGQPTVLETNAIYNATTDPKTCLFGLVFTTDGRIAANGFRVLDDDRVYHPLYEAAITIRDEAYQQNPEIEAVFEPIAQALTQEVMTSLNEQRSVTETPERDVARTWLAEQGFIGAAS
jgi:osmoprotectant transport system substrate-binding protein